MISYLTGFDKENCYGCGACADVCSCGAITMQTDREGFVYPVVDGSKCVKCGKCVKICPASADVSRSAPIEVWAAEYKEESVVLSSASGGAFCAVVRSADPGTVVFGAQWTGRSTVSHAGVDSSDAYDRFRKSKYVQSDAVGVFKQTEDLLKNGVFVIFSGTPCQVGALKSYLKRDYDNLLLVDLICHGVSNGELLEKCLKCFEKNDIIRRAEFRHKEKRSGRWNSKLIKLEFDSGKTKVLDENTCGFIRAYDNGLIFRPSCYSCRYSSVNRVSDITLGDFWSGRDLGFDPHHGASLILVNTPKGLRFFERMKDKLSLCRIDVENAVKSNARLIRPDKAHPRRSEFFKSIDGLSKNDFESSVERILPRVARWKIAAHKIKRIFIR